MTQDLLRFEFAAEMLIVICGLAVVVLSIFYGLFNKKRKKEKKKCQK